MKFVVFNEGRPGLLTDRGIIDITELVRPLGASGGQDAVRSLIEHFEELRPDLNRMAMESPALPVSEVTLQAPCTARQNPRHGGQLP